MKKGLLVFLCLCVLLHVFVCLPVSADDTTKANLSVYYLQSDPRWADIPVGSLTIAESACGIAATCNAVYYVTGQQPDLPAVAKWAHEAGLLNAPGVPGCYRSVFQRAGEQYGGQYGFTATEFRYGSVKSSELLSHLASGGTAALHVPGHFMTVIKYDEQTKRYLVIDPLPGDVGRYDRRRAGLTHTGGDWLTADALSQGIIAVDGYALFSRTLSDRERDVFLPACTAASLKGLLSRK